MNNYERHLSMLFSRLIWPSPLARERACTAIAQLVLTPVHAPSIKAFFLRWLASQHHESVCGVALLALLRAKMDGSGACPIPATEVRGSLPWPSLQSWLLLAEYEPEAVAQDELGGWHSGDPPDSFVAQPFFDEFVHNYLPPVYNNWAKEFEQRMLIPFRRQWAYEWDIVLGRRRFELSPSSLRFWFGHQEADERCVAMAPPLSEVYRSAYLRALAWAVDTRGMDWNSAIVRAADTVPINLELWQLKPGGRPDWWPKASLSSTPLETAPRDIWPTVDELWRQQQGGSAPWSPEWVLTQADGRVRGGDTLYDLSLLACFQRPLDAGVPEIGEVFEWCADSDETFLSPVTESRIRLAGKVRPERLWNLTTRIGGWSVVPAVGQFQLGGTVSRWQWWRWYRGIWGPAASLMRDGYTFHRDDNSLAFETGGEVIARWSDWTEELRERLAPDTLPATGQMLLIRREEIERFATQNRLRFCWLVRLTVFYRQRHYELYQTFHDDRVYGASKIILPD